MGNLALWIALVWGFADTASLERDVAFHAAGGETQTVGVSRALLSLPHRARVALGTLPVAVLMLLGFWSAVCRRSHWHKPVLVDARGD